MGGVVVHDKVNVPIGRHLFLQLIEEPDELFGAVPGKTTADHFPVQNIERREQSGRTRGACSRVFAVPAGPALTAEGERCGREPVSGSSHLRIAPGPGRAD